MPRGHSLVGEAYPLHTGEYKFFFYDDQSSGIDYKVQAIKFTDAPIYGYNYVITSAFDSVESNLAIYEPSNECYYTAFDIDLDHGNVGFPFIGMGFYEFRIIREGSLVWLFRADLRQCNSPLDIYFNYHHYSADSALFIVENDPYEDTLAYGDTVYSWETYLEDKDWSCLTKKLELTNSFDGDIKTDVKIKLEDIKNGFPFEQYSIGYEFTPGDSASFWRNDTCTLSVTNNVISHENSEYKIRHWINDENVGFKQDIRILSNFTDITAYFIPTIELTISNNLEGNSGGIYQVEWDKLPSIRDTVNSGIPANVFKYEEPTFDYHNIILNSLLSNIGGTDWYFYHWGNDIDDDDTLKSNLQITDTVSYTANYKGHFRSNKSYAYNRNNQRKIVRTDNDTYHTVYESFYGFWYMKSQTSNFHGTWDSEKQLVEADAEEDFILRNPSIDYYGNKLVVATELFDIDAYIYLLMYDPTTGTLDTPIEVAEIDTSYFGNAYPVVAYTKNEILVIWKPSSTSSLKYRILEEDQGSWSWAGSAQTLPNTDSNSKYPTIAGTKTDSDVKTEIYIAWQHSTSYIRYMKYYHKGGDPEFKYYTTISTGSGYSSNKYPSISLISNDDPIVSWKGYKRVREMEKPLAKPTGGWVIYNRTVVRPSAGGTWGSFYTTGSNVLYTNNNSTSSDSNHTIIAFCQNSGQTSKYIRRIDGTYTTGTLSDNGIQNHVSNGDKLSEVEVLIFDDSGQSPYPLIRSTTDFTGGISKIITKPQISYGRTGVVIINGIEFVFEISDIQVNGQNVMFIDRDDTLAVNNIDELNQAVRTQPFKLDSNSDFLFMLTSYIALPGIQEISLNENDEVNFQLELVKLKTDEVVAIFDQMTYAKFNIFDFKVADYSVNCSGIEPGEYYVRLNTSTTGKGSFFLTNTHNDRSDLARPSHERINLKDYITPITYNLSQNYPNPFNPVTKIKFSISNDDIVTVEIFNTLGQKIKTLLNRKFQSGFHEVEFNARDLASGVYYYRIEAGEFQDVKKMILIR